jgi:hypothetical protein
MQPSLAASISPSLTFLLSYSFSSNGLLKDMPWKIGQMVFQPPDQFSFFSSDYSPPGIIYGLDMVSPESQLLSMSSVVGITNGFFSLFNFGLSNADGKHDCSLGQCVPLCLPCHL